MDHPQSTTAAPFGRQAKDGSGAPTSAAFIRSFRCLPALLCLGLVLSACGNRGSLYLPDDEPLAAGNPAATGQVGAASTQAPEAEAAGGVSEGPERAETSAEEDADGEDDARSPDTDRGDAAIGTRP